MWVTKNYKIYATIVFFKKKLASSHRKLCYPWHLSNNKVRYYIIITEEKVPKYPKLRKFVSTGLNLFLPSHVFILK